MPDGSFLTIHPEAEALEPSATPAWPNPHPKPPCPRLPARAAAPSPTRPPATTTRPPPHRRRLVLPHRRGLTLPPFETIMERDASRSALAWNDSPDIGFDRAVNPYRGCEHGCIYCYARPSHATSATPPASTSRPVSPSSPRSPPSSEKELSKPGYKPATVALGSNTDPYQPVEAHHAPHPLRARGAGALQPPRSASSPSPPAFWPTPTSSSAWPRRTWFASGSPSPRWTRRWPASWNPAPARPPDAFKPSPP